LKTLKNVTRKKRKKPFFLHLWIIMCTTVCPVGRYGSSCGSRCTRCREDTLISGAARCYRDGRCV